MATSSIPALSVIIMTYNEEENLPRCLASVKGIGEEIFILDSFSTDRTLEIARSFQARVEQHTFGSYVEQKKRLIAKAANDWVFCIDADEYLSETLRRSIMEARAKGGYDGYFNNRRSCIGDHWINHGNWYPDRKIRLFDRRKVHIEGRDPHDVTVPLPGARIGILKGDLMHYADKDFASRLRKNEKHSTRAAEALHANGIKPSWWRRLIKPGARFLTSYVLRLGFLDGYYGWFVAKSEGQYVRM
ncbi:MAG TPA: glycosyltransferase family 2 protein, partial [Saprospiraceae bacterium]|nr:glycosyltransferase family 2 protein [Saprospiraceae bacterium]